MSEYAISTESLAKHYKNIRAVDGLNLRVPAGAVYGFLGRNGAGKTTTIKMLLGFARANAGSAEILGMNVNGQLQQILKRTAFVGENKTLYDNFTPTEMARFHKGFYPNWSDGDATKFAQSLEIPMDQKFKKLSKGNRTKVWLLLALAQNADLMILDEPTTALDPLTADVFLRILAESYAGEERTVLFSSHNLAEVEQIADWVGIIDRGKLLLEARLEDIRNNFRLIVAGGNGLPLVRQAPVVSAVAAANLVRYVIDRDGDGWQTQLRAQGATILESLPLSLKDVFLELVRKEEPCTSGSAGETLATPSLARA
ncbi:MAG: ABC transporter ATP-binding protein [Acidobacteria bacterium]|nr:ABC transporter ATP-binding protein [Acidobacteriota bacterium]